MLDVTKLSPAEIFFFPASISILQKHLGSLYTNIKPAARNQDVIFDSDLLFEKQSKNFNLFYQLRSTLKSDCYCHYLYLLSPV